MKNLKIYLFACIALVMYVFTETVAKDILWLRMIFSFVAYYAMMYLIGFFLGVIRQKVRAKKELKRQNREEKWAEVSAAEFESMQRIEDMHQHMRNDREE